MFDQLCELVDPFVSEGDLVGCSPEDPKVGGVESGTKNCPICHEFAISIIFSWRLSVSRQFVS
jgi:hypothetical protein